MRIKPLLMVQALLHWGVCITLGTYLLLKSHPGTIPKIRQLSKSFYLLCKAAYLGGGSALTVHHTRQSSNQHLRNSYQGNNGNIETNSTMQKQ